MQGKNEMGVLATQKKPGGTRGGDAALLADLQLGKVEEVYTLDHTLRVFILFLLLVALLLFSLGIWQFTSQFGFPMSLVWSLGLVVVPLLLIFLVRYRYGGMRVYICTDGLLYLWRKQRESRRWDEVGGVRRHFIGGRYSHTNIWITSKDGRKFSFDPPDREFHLLATLGTVKNNVLPLARRKPPC